MSLLYILQQLLNALQVTVIYALLSSAFVLFYGVTNRINLAFGALAMWAACLTIMMVSLLEGVTFWPLIWVILAGGAMAIFNTALLGFSIHHLVVKKLIGGRMQTMLIATIAIAIILEEAMRLINDSRELWLRPVFADPVPLVTGGAFPIQITPLQIAVLLLGFGMVLLLILMMKRHPFGLRWRAVADDLRMAALCGISLSAVIGLSFVLATIMAALAGSMIALLYGSASFAMGTIIGLKSMFIAVIGGLRSLQGALAASVALAFFETFWSAYFEIAYRDVAAFCVLTLFLIIKPEGLRRR